MKQTWVWLLVGLAVLWWLNRANQTKASGSVLGLGWIGNLGGR